MSPPVLILASASPRRRQLLAELGLPFDSVTAQVVENEDPATDPRVMVSHNASIKAILKLMKMLRQVKRIVA